MKIKFYHSSSGRSPVEEFIKDLPKEAQEEVFDAIVLLNSGKVLGMPLSRNLANICGGLSELRFRDRNGQIRIFYYIKKADAIYILHAMRKKEQKLSKQDIELVLKRMKEV